jgi:hypothetical protein
MHFTYAPAPDLKQLFQGDLIIRTPAVDAILTTVHPHYKKEDYKAFIILTQTCDLVRRNGGECSARYISIAAVRPLELVLKRTFADHCKNKWEEDFRITNHKTREKLRLFLARLLNNNEDEYFFLRRDAPSGLNEDCCAFLQLSIAVKSELHFATLLEAKRLELDDSFQHKLGYLVGKMYARVGTPDWVPTHFPNENEFNDLINQMIDSNDFATWIDDNIYKDLVSKFKNNGNNAVTQDTLIQWVKEIQGAKQQRRKNVLDAIQKEMADVGVAEEISKKAVARINSSPIFASIFKG